MEEILKTIDLSKRFPGVQALDKITVNFNRGEIRALVGENGAGKSTFSGILMGIIKPDSGKILVSGREASINNAQQARDYGIGCVYQESSLMDYMSVAENIFLGKQSLFKTSGILSYSKLFKAAQESLEKIGIDLNVKGLAGFLSPDQSKLVELVKVLVNDPEILILDEITAAFDYGSVKKLFGIIKNIKEEGKTVIFISHRLKEALEIADTATVLKEGKLVKTLKLDGVREKDLISLMTGKEIKQIFPEKVTVSQKERDIILSIRNLSSDSRLEKINIDIKNSEIVALAGLKGHGQSTLLRTIFGLRPKISGEIYLNGKKVNINNPVDALMLGVVMISNRREDELCFTHSVRMNIALASLDRRKRLGFVDLQNEKKEISSIKSKLNIITPSLDAEVINLSGGNKQKVIFGKWLLTEPKVLLCDDPAEGLDIGSKSEVYHIIRGLAEEGKGILLVLSDMTEILNLPDRVLVMREGKIVKEFNITDSIDKQKLESEILQASMGVE